MKYNVFVDKMLRENEKTLHCFLGLSAEAGEVLDLYKKERIYDADVETQDYIDELGDVLFYFTGILNHLGIDQKTIEDNNIHKLTKRYGNGFS